MNWSQDLAEVPAFPPVTVKLLHHLSIDPVDLHGLAELVSSDPALSGVVLAYANSVLYGGQSKVSSVSRALLRLGTDTTREVVATLATASCFRKATEVEEIGRCWRHTLACAIIAEEIARVAGQFQAQAYTAALLHDLGRLALAVAYRAQYVKLIQESSLKCMDLLDHETTLFGINHAAAGCWLVEQWQLPEELRIIAGRHHDLPESTELTLLLIVHTACLIADAIGYDVCPAVAPVSFAEAVQRLPPQVASRFVWTEESLRSRVAERFEEFVDCPAPRSPDIEPVPAAAIMETGNEPESSPWVLLLALTLLGSLIVLYWPR